MSTQWRPYFPAADYAEYIVKLAALSVCGMLFPVIRHSTCLCGGRAVVD